MRSTHLKLIAAFLACSISLSCIPLVLADQAASSLSLLAQAEASFPIGETVMCSPSYNDSDWRKGVIVDNNPDAPFQRVNVEAGNGRAGGVYMVSRKSIKALAGFKAPGETAAPAATPAPAPSTAPATHAGAAAGNNFQIGETVWASPSYHEHDWRQGTIVDNDPNAPFMRVNVPAGNGRAGGIYIVSRSAIRKLAQGPGSVAAGVAHQVAAIHNPTAAPAQNQLAPAAPSPAVNHASAPAPAKGTASCCPSQQNLSGGSLEQIFKRAIRDRYMHEDGSSFDVGGYPSSITFHSFSMGAPRPYKMPEAWAYHTGSPDGPGGREGTQVYEIVTKYTVCTDEQPNPEYGYKGEIKYTEAECTFYGLKNATTGVWQVNLGPGKTDFHTVKK